MRFGYNSNGFVHHRLEDALPWLAGIGYRAVAITPDIPHLDPATTTEADLERFGELCRSLDLSVVLETGSRFLLDPKRKHRPNLLEESPDEREQRLELLRMMADWCAPLGATVLSLWSGVRPDGVAEAAATDRLRKALEELTPRANAAGAVVALEPEPQHHIGDLRAFEAFNLDSPGLCRLTLDVGHVLATEECEPHEAVREWSDEIANVHLDDAERGVHRHFAPGEGSIDWDALLDSLRVLDAETPCCFELSRDSHRFHELAAGCLPR